MSIKNSKLLIWIVLCAAVSLGLADCHFSASSIAYPIAKCDSKFQKPDLPDKIDTDLFQINRIDYRSNKEENIECKKLVFYEYYSKKNGAIDTSKPRLTFYVGYPKESSCKFVVSSTWFGPNTTTSPDEIELEKKGYIIEANDFLKKLLAKENISIEYEKADYSDFKNSDDYHKWCESI